MMKKLFCVVGFLILFVGSASAQLPNFGAPMIPNASSAGSAGGGVTSFSAGTTGLTPSSPTTGPVVLSGTLGIANGGTGLTSFGSGVATALGNPAGGSGGFALESQLATLPLSVANGGTACSVASITCFNNITGFTAAGTTGTTSTNLVFSASPTLTGTVTLPDSSTANSAGLNSVMSLGIGVAAPGTGEIEVTQSSTEVLLLDTNPYLHTGAVMVGGANNVGLEGYDTLAHSIGRTITGRVWRLNAGDVTGAGAFITNNSGGVGWTSVAPGGGSDAGNTPDTILLRQSAGVVQVGTSLSSPNASGSLLLTNLTASGTLTNSGIASTAQADVVCTTSAGVFSYQVSATGCAVSSERFKNMKSPLSRDEIIRVALGLTQDKRWTYKDPHFGDPSEYIGFTAEQIAALDDRFITRDGDGLPYAIKHQQLIETAIVGLVLTVHDLQRQVEDLTRNSR